MSSNLMNKSKFSTKTPGNSKMLIPKSRYQPQSLILNPIKMITKFPKLWIVFNSNWLTLRIIFIRSRFLKFTPSLKESFLNQEIIKHFRRKILKSILLKWFKTTNKDSRKRKLLTLGALKKFHSIYRRKIPF